MPSEWLPLIWGKDTALEFDTEKEAKDIMDLIMGHYNRVAQTLTPPCDTLETLYEVDPTNGKILWEPWVHGFCTAMELRPEAWDEMTTSGGDDVSSVIVMFYMMNALYTGKMELPSEEIDKSFNDAPDMIPEMVMTLNNWVKSQHHNNAFDIFAANSNIAPHKNNKVGRNKPCPCGSGKKYKKCCG